jgi:hypothetical protein
MNAAPAIAAASEVIRTDVATEPLKSSIMR